MSLIVANGMVVTLDRARTVYERSDIRIDGDRISAIGADLAAKESENVLDATEAIVLPGFLNAHTHSPENLARGVVDRVRYESWFDAIWPTLDALNASQIRLAILLGCAEMLRSGTTAVIDHFRQTPLSPDAVETAVAAYRESGMRCGLALMLRDRVMPPWVKSTWNPEHLLNSIFPEDRSNGGLVHLMLAPSAPHRCTDRLLEKIADVRTNRGIYVHTHIDESESQRKEALDCFGHSSISHLDALGLLDERTSLAHCVWLDGDDLDRIAGTGATVVHNPISNLRLGNGVARVPEMLERGIAVALGSDGAASNDSQNILEVMKATSLVAGMGGFRSRPTVNDILNMTTGTVARRFGMRDIGSIEVGLHADLVVFERMDPRLFPLNDVHRQIVFAGAGLSVRHVVIAGKIVVRDGQIMTFDEREIYAEASRFEGALSRN